MKTLKNILGFIVDHWPKVIFTLIFIPICLYIIFGKTLIGIGLLLVLFMLSAHLHDEIFQALGLFIGYVIIGGLFSVTYEFGEKVEVKRVNVKYKIIHTDELNNKLLVFNGNKTVIDYNYKHPINYYTNYTFYGKVLTNKNYWGYPIEHTYYYYSFEGKEVKL